MLIRWMFRSNKLRNCLYEDLMSFLAYLIIHRQYVQWDWLKNKFPQIGHLKWMMAAFLLVFSHCNRCLIRNKFSEIVSYELFVYFYYKKANYIKVTLIQKSYFGLNVNNKKINFSASYLYHNRFLIFLHFQLIIYILVNYDVY